MENPGFENTENNELHGLKTTDNGHIPVENGLSIPTKTVDDDVVSDRSSVKLKKEVGLISGIALIVGTMIGSGIFVSPGGLLEKTGSVGMSLVVWSACGLLSTLAAISYIELGIVIPDSGAEYAYILAALGSYPAFLYSWVCTLVLKPSSSAVITLAFAEYTVEAVVTMSANVGEVPPIVVKLLAALAIIIITYVNCASVKLASKVQIVFTAAKLIAIAIIMIVGIYKVALGYVDNLENAFVGSTTSPGVIASAFYSGLWAYDGWNNLNFCMEEVKNPYRNLPLAILIGLPMVTICYLMVNISYLTVMTPAEIIASPAVAVTFSTRVLGAAAFIMPVSVAMSTFGAANGSQFTAGRLSYAASRQGHQVEVLSYINIYNYTPSIALIFNAVIALVMIIPGSIDGLIELFNFCAWIFYGGAMLAVLILRRKMKDAPRPFKVPLVIPIIVLLASIYLIAAPIIDDPKMEYFYALAFIFSGTFLYVPFVYYKKELPFMKTITILVQLLFNVTPPDEDLKTK